MSIFSGQTPSSILKKTPSLKSRLSQINSTPSRVRFTLPYSKKVRSILKDYIEKNSIKEYENLVCLIRDSELFNEDISSLLKEATESISLLDQNLRLFIHALLAIDWINRNDRVKQEYRRFIGHLVAAHNCHAEDVINRLVSLFIPSVTDPEWDNGAPLKDYLKKCQYVHSLLNDLLITLPMCKGLLINSITNLFPYAKRSAHIHECYIQNLLKILCYQSSLRRSIFELIFSKLVKMDTNMPRQEIRKAEKEEDVFMIDDEAKSVANFDNLTADTLDVCLDNIFSYCLTECYTKTHELDWGKTICLYQDVLAVFDKIILPTYNTQHVQFILFITCSLKASLCTDFLNYLWRKVTDPNVPSVVRQSSVNYMVSFITKAKYVPLYMVEGTLEQIAKWIHSYIKTQDGLECVNCDVRLHLVFYTVCQALFYVIAFRHKDLLKPKKYKKRTGFLERLNLGKIVTSQLNPLRVCQDAVVQNFAAVMRKYRLFYCYAIIEQNARNVLQNIYKDEKGSIVISSNTLEVYYPFDTYVLERSGDKITPHYREYKEIKLSQDVEMKESIDQDDFLDENLSSMFSY